jgi:hypothetical protein
MPVFLGLTAVVIDGSTLMVKHRALQNAADAAALAAAQELPASGRCDAVCRVKVAAKIKEYSLDNGGPLSLNGGTYPGDPSRCQAATDTNCYTTPYKGSDQLVEVRFHETVSTLFTDVLHLGKLFGVSARAVSSAQAQTSVNTTPGQTNLGLTQDPVTQPGATHTTTDPDQVVGGEGAMAFAMSTSCTKDPGGAAITYQGAGGGAIGALMTNGGISVGGNGNDKTIDYLALGRNGDTVGNVSCYDNPNRATILHPPVTGPWSPPRGWPVTPPNPPSPCTLLASISDVTTASWNSGLATVTTYDGNNLSAGDSITVSGVSNRFNGSFVVKDVLSPTKFTYLDANKNGGSNATGGTVKSGTAPVSISSGWAATHPPGNYCARGADLSLGNGTDLTGGLGYTFFVLSSAHASGAPTGGNITISGGKYKCYQLCQSTPTLDSTLFFAGADISMSGSSPTLSGNIYAPNGDISFAGGGVSGGAGFIESQTIKFTGNFASYVGTGPNVGGQTVPGATHTTTDPDTVIPGYTDPGSTFPGSTTTVVTGTTYNLDE